MVVSSISNSFVLKYQVDFWQILPMPGNNMDRVIELVRVLQKILCV